MTSRFKLLIKSGFFARKSTFNHCMCLNIYAVILLIMHTHMKITGTTSGMVALTLMHLIHVYRVYIFLAE